MTVTTKSKLAKTSPGLERMKTNLGPMKTEVLRQSVIADQTKAKAEVAKPFKAKQTNADTRTISVLAKSNPHAADSRRASWFKLLKNGMTVDDAIKLGLRSAYLERIAARKIIEFD